MSKKESKEFFSFDANVIKSDNDLTVFDVDGIKFEIPTKILSKTLLENGKIKLVFSSLSEYENRLQGNAKNILNEIIGF